MAFVLVCLNSKETRIAAADLNAPKVLSVIVTKPALETNVSILVPERVQPPPSAMSSITFRCAVVLNV